MGGSEGIPRRRNRTRHQTGRCQVHRRTGLRRRRRVHLQHHVHDHAVDAPRPRRRLAGAPVTRIGVILGSTRPGRRGEPVPRWVMDEAGRRNDAEFELVDLADYPLPHLDEPLPPSMGQYQNAHTQEWAATIGRFDGYVFITPEYNHSTSGVLKNAIDFLYA